MLLPLVDPGDSAGALPDLPRHHNGIQWRIQNFTFGDMCAKTKELGPVGASVRRARPLDPPIGPNSLQILA